MLQLTLSANILPMVLEVLNHMMLMPLMEHYSGRSRTLSLVQNLLANSMVPFSDIIDLATEIVTPDRTLRSLSNHLVEKEVVILDPWEPSQVVHTMVRIIQLQFTEIEWQQNWTQICSMTQTIGIRKQVNEVLWERAKLPALKLNADERSLGNLGRSGAGDNLKSYRGEIIIVCSYSLGHSSNNAARRKSHSYWDTVVSGQYN
ncbi:hypothetical protein HAX54_034523 [Datura stramonium]|uniref:Uncharacterized protein n=1 Tax=Datura stramonium TaxID=4076 RepID=A0ABS8VF67_DATST|nr:hypothetical protein [Datura stramonium]